MRFFKTLIKFFFLRIVLMVPGIVSHAQTIERFNTFNYSVNEGLLQSTIADMAFDKNNFCWLSFPNGIQKFDGKNFVEVPLQPGLPDDKFVRFFRCSNGDLLLSHTKGISKYEISNNRLIQIYNNPPSANTPVIFIGEDEDIIFFHTETGNITGINNHTFKIVSQTKDNLPGSSGEYIPRFSDNIINHKTVINANYKLYLWDLKQCKLLAVSEAFPDMSYYLLRLKTENEVLYNRYSTNNALHLYNFSTKQNIKITVKGKDDIQLSRCSIYPWKNKLLIAFNNRVFETDTSLTMLKSELVNFQNQPIAGNLSIARIKEDNFGNLYFQTVTGGIRKIIGDNYPVKYYGTFKKEDNFILSLLPDKKHNRILAGTSGNGLLIFDTLQTLIKHIKILPGAKLPFSPNNIIKDNSGDYLLFNSGEKKVWQLSHDFSKINPISISSLLPENKKFISYFGNFLFQNEQDAVVQTQGHIYKVSFSLNTVTEHEITTTYTMSGLFYHTFIITHTNDELIFLDTASFKKLKKISFKNTGGVRCFAADQTANICIGSNKGIFKIDSSGNILLHLNKINGLPDECIYAMCFDNTGLLWCSTNKGIFKVDKDNSIFQLTKEDGLQENEFNTNVVAKTEDGEIFFGGVNGVSSFFPSEINGLQEKINLLFTSIKINNKEVFTDTAVWNIDKIDLPYNQNSLFFDFIAMANNNPGQYIYQYRMIGIDEEWIQNNGLQTVRYFLPPGKYVFHVYASRNFSKDAKPMKSISITIHQPFWKTWWFITVLALILVTSFSYGINQYNQRKYQKKLAAFESENKIRLERERISRDLHDSIGAYANTVLYKSELLQEKEVIEERTELIKDLRFASKDIITSLRETIWALKKDNYTAEDCLLRIRNFIQPFTKYYNQIQFKVEGEAPPTRILHYNKALHLVRIVQEAVTNAIKHAEAKNIIVTSLSGENNEWKLSVTDDGKGFDYAAAKHAQKGNGLHNMEQRADEAGLMLTINSVKNTGTSVTITI